MTDRQTDRPEPISFCVYLASSMRTRGGSKQTTGPCDDDDDDIRERKGKGGRGSVGGGLFGEEIRIKLDRES